MKKIVFFILLFNFQASIMGQTPIIEWQNSYGGSNVDAIYSIDITSDGGYIMTGKTNSTDGDITSIHGIIDFWVIKINAVGTIEWQKTYGGSREDSATDIKQTSDGGYIVLGTTESNDGNITNFKGALDFWILKLTNNGSIEWQKTIGGTFGDFGNSIEQTTDGGFILLGDTRSDDGDVSGNHSAPLPDFWAVKLNSIGTIEWQRPLGGFSTEMSGKMKQTSDGGYIAVGASYSNDGDVSGNHGQSDYWVVKLNSTGNIEWQKSIGGSADDYANDFVETSDGGFVIVGNSFSVDGDRVASSHGGCDYWIVKINSTGNIIWEKSFGENSNEIPYSIKQTLDGGVIIAGWKDIIGLNGIDYYVVKLDAIGNLEWEKTMGGYNYDRAYCILEVSEGSYIVAGPSSSNNGDVTGNHGGPDAWIVKLLACNTSTPTGNPNQIFCKSQNPTVADLTPNSSSIKWYSTPTSTSQLINTIALIDGQTYYAARQISNCPESNLRLAVTVTINQTPNPSISISQTFCKSENATISDLNAVGQNIQWYASDSDVNNLPFNTILQNSTNYYVTQTINGCDSDRTPINVTVNSVSLPTSTSPQNFCIQQNANLNSVVITGQNIKWYDLPTNGNMLTGTTLLIDGATYYASQTINSCESLRIPILINVQDTMAPNGIALQTFCSTQNPTLNDISVSGTNLIWYTSASGSATLPNTTLLANNNSYFASQTINGCESTNRLSVNISLISNLNANNYSETICYDFNNATETINLADFQNNLIANPATVSFAYYTTLLSATNQNTIELISPISSYNPFPGLNEIYVRITSNNGCYQIVSLALNIVSKPIINLLDIVPICERSNVTVDAGANFDSYLWSTGSTDQSITVSNVGNYNVTVTKNMGNIVCSKSKNFEIVYSNVATINNIIIQDWTVNDNIIVVNLSVLSIGNYEYSIDGLNYQTSNTFTGLNNGIYTIFIKDMNGCGITKEEVYLLMYEKYFTPNNDGYNDAWYIHDANLEVGMIIRIFDRYGKLLEQLNNTTSWDGTYNGNALPADDYWFVVTRANGIQQKGHFTLKR